MAGLSEVMEYAELLTVAPLKVDEDHCVRVRNRNATCSRCEDACFTAAIAIQDNEVRINGSACVNCGACVGVCPTSCIAAVDPAQQKALVDALAATLRAGGVACIACARKASKHAADPELFAQVPCLAHVSEGLFADMAAAGVQDIVLIDGGCSTCKYGAAEPVIDEAVDNAAKLFEAAGVPSIITRSTDFPPELDGTFRRDVRGSDRRGLMMQTGRYLRTVAGSVAQKTIDDKLGTAQQPRTLKERLGAGKSGKMPQFEPEANMRLIDSLLEAAGPASDAAALLEGVAPAPDAALCQPLGTRRFGSVAIDAAACSGCGLCVLFCPTAALKHAELDQPSDPEMRYLEFQAADCTQCRMCADVCLRDCLTVAADVALCEVLSFEPRLLEIPRPKERETLFSKYRRT